MHFLWNGLKLSPTIEVPEPTVNDLNITQNKRRQWGIVIIYNVIHQLALLQGSSSPLTENLELENSPKMSNNNMNSASKKKDELLGKYKYLYYRANMSVHSLMIRFNCKINLVFLKPSFKCKIKDRKGFLLHITF